MNTRVIAVADTVLNTAVEVRDLRVDMADGTEIVGDIAFTIRAGEVLGLVGESGSGKTTVGMALLGFARGGARLAGGTVFIAGDHSRNMVTLSLAEKTRLRGRTVAYVPQDPASALNPSLKLRVQLAEIITAHEPATKPADIERRIREAVADVGLPDTAAFLNRYPHQLSGGQQQRIGIAMAVILKPRLIVLDEPTTGLDVATQNLILDIVRRLCREHGIGALYVTHDLSVVASIADRVMVMYAGRVAEIGATTRVLRQPLHPYSQALITAVPELRRRTELTNIPGGAPRPNRRPDGCFFHPRCAFALNACRTGSVALAQAGQDHEVRCLNSGKLVFSEPRLLPDPEVANPASTTANTVVEVQDLKVSYGTFNVLDGVSFTLERGECLAVVGESGSGKSTLSRALIGLVPQQKSTLILNYEELAPCARDRRREQLQQMQYIFQSPHNSLNPRQTVEDLVGLVHDTFHLRSSAERRKAIAAVLHQVSLPEEAMHSYPDQLSGGERQRVSIARALMADPQVLICDEITSALDVSVQAAIVNLLKELQATRNLTMLFVTHNLALVRNLADRVLVLNKGKVAEIGRVGDIIDRPQHPYTQTLIANALDTESA